LCGQLGHQASQCSSGTVNWRQVYTDDAFILRPATYWSDEVAHRKAKLVDTTDTERKARLFAEAQAKTQGLDWDEMMQRAALLQSQDPSVTVPKVEVVDTPAPVVAAPGDLPEGWASAQDPQGRTYYYEKKTMKTQWDKPTTDVEFE